MGDGDVATIAAHLSPASDTSDDELLDTVRKSGQSFAWFHPALAGPASGLTSFRGA